MKGKSDQIWRWLRRLVCTHPARLRAFAGLVVVGNIATVAVESCKGCGKVFAAGRWR